MRTLRRFFLFTTVALVLLAGVASAVDGDADNDGIADAQDNCAQIANPDQADWNTDGAGDACDDTDADTLSDGYELSATYGPADAPRKTDKEKRDTDADGWGDGYEVNTEKTDPTLKDSDGDGWEDPTERGAGTDPLNPDTDGDGRKDSTDNCAKVYNPDQKDNDGDRRGNACDSTPDPEPKPKTTEEKVKEAAENAPGTAQGAVNDVVEQLPGVDIRPATDIVQMGTDGVVFVIRQTTPRSFEITAFKSVTGEPVVFDLPQAAYSMNGPVGAFFHEVGSTTRPSDGSRLNIYWKYNKVLKKIFVKAVLNRQTFTDVNVAFAAPVKDYPACSLASVPGAGCTETAMAFYNPEKHNTAALDALDAVPYATDLS